MRFLLPLLFSFMVLADTPPPNTVKAKMYSGDGAQQITATAGALDVNVTGGGGGGTVDQGAAGLDPWLVQITNSSLAVTGTFFQATQPVSGSLGRTWVLLDSTDTVGSVQSGAWTVGRNWTLNSGTDSVTISGSVTATNSANGPVGSPPPADATQIAGTDGVNLIALKSSSIGVLSVDASGSSISVSNFPATQPVSQVGPWTVSQGSPPWSMNLSQLNGLTPSATNYLPSRITNGTSYVDPTQIRALSSATDSVEILATSLPLPTGAATSANQTTANSSLASIDSKLTSPLAVTGTFFQATQPVSIAGTVAVSGPLTDTQLRASAVPVSLSGGTISGNVTVVQATAGNLNATVVGSVTANAGTNLNTSLLALDTSVNGILRAQGSSTASQTGPLIQGAVTTAAPSYTTAQTSPISLTTAGAVRTDSSATTQPISAAALPLPSGASTAANQTTANSSLSSIDGKIPSGLTVTSTRLLVDGSGVTQPVSGSVTANAGTNLNTSALALSATQTNGNQKSQIVDGAGAVVGPVTTISSVNYMPVVLAASGTTGAAVPSRTILVGGSDGTNLRSFSTDTSGNLNVNTASSTGRTTVNLARNDYSTTNVTTAAYVQLIASTADTVNQLYIFDSSGQTLFLAVGAAASEVNKAYIVPGGNGILNLTIPSGSRVSIKAVSATASAGELSITFLK